jgi:hypothetical protein
MVGKLLVVSLKNLYSGRLLFSSGFFSSVVSFALRTRRRVEMDTNAIVAKLEQERDRLDQAIRALTARPGGDKRRVRPRLSAAARKRISQGMRRTWAERKRKTKAA